jgi:predicted AAA+ superfamily ATPase
MIFSDVLQHDILNREQILNIDEFVSIYRYLQNNLGKETSLLNIFNYLNSLKSNISQPLVSKYTKILLSCFLIQKINKYDLAGKKILDNKIKYYPIDIGMRNSIAKTFANNRGKILEAIVLNELLYRGYEVNIGVSQSISEIDFIARKNTNTVYIQICEHLTEDIKDREIKNLLRLKNGFEKILISLDEINTVDDNGIKYINLID